LERRVLPVSASIMVKALAVKHSQSSWAKAGQTAARTNRQAAKAINRRYLIGILALLEDVFLPMIFPLIPRYLDNIRKKFEFSKRLENGNRAKTACQPGQDEINP
jgi:hypothetical protein